MDAALYEKLAAGKQAFFSLLEVLDITPPPWATISFGFTRTSKKLFDVSFFEDAKDFFVWYSRVLVGGAEDLKTASFSRDSDKEWQVFVPPTLIGVNLKTRLRF